MQNCRGQRGEINYKHVPEWIRTRNPVIDSTPDRDTLLTYHLLHTEVVG